LWTLHLNANRHASLMVDEFDRRELIRTVVGSSVMALSIAEYALLVFRWGSFRDWL
jgi:hypothetical protein